MKEDIVQSQIRLIAFKAANFSLASEKRKTKEKKISDPRFDIKLSNILIEDKENYFVKVFHVGLEVQLEIEIIKVLVEFHTVFESGSKIDNNFLQSSFANISAPAIGFPYVRSFISTILLQAGYPPVMLPSINFVQFAASNSTEGQSE